MIGRGSDSDAQPRIVALGGGHGLYATLSAVRRVTPNVTAVVTVADDGGSSGRLRSELGVIPPGDLRMALAALAGAGPEAELWTRTVQHRFRGTGALAGHSVGNIILAGLTEVLGDPVAALAELARVMQVEGAVLPMSVRPLTIEAEVAGLEADPRVNRPIRGQVAVATTPGQVRRVRLIPSDPPGCVQAVRAILEADLVVLGPGSWFSSVIPHVLVPEQLHALKSTRARKALVLNLAPQAGETGGFSAERHLHVLYQHAPGLRVNDVIVDAGLVPPGRERDHLVRAAGQLGGVVQFCDVANEGTQTHNPGKLAAVLQTTLSPPNQPATRDSARSGGLRRLVSGESPSGGKGQATWR